MNNERNDITNTTLSLNYQRPRNIFPSDYQKRSQTIFYKERMKTDQVLGPQEDLREQVFTMEKELFASMNLEWGVDIITEDVPILQDEEYYYIHLVRTAKPDPNKENFLLIHGFISSYMHFLGIIPYMIKRYNIFLPDTIGMGLSSRPQVTFTTPMQCEDYFIGVYHLFIKGLFFEGRFNIKKEYYLCGHSLGGFIASRYMVRFPIGIKKALLLSPAGITDYNIPGTNFYGNTSCCFYCSAVCCTTCVWPCTLRVQSLYNCCVCHNCIKKYYGVMGLELDESEIKPNKDGTKFNIDYEKLRKMIKQLTIMSLDYPTDLYQCAYYLFKTPPPAAFYPLEKRLMFYNKIPTIFVFGEKDWMDREGAYRLSKYNPSLYKVFTVSRGGHSFSWQNPKELCSIIGQYFEE